jgi:hypothetical protein
MILEHAKGNNNVEWQLAKISKAGRLAILFISGTSKK